MCFLSHLHVGPCIDVHLCRAPPDRRVRSRSEKETVHNKDRTRKNMIKMCANTSVVCVCLDVRAHTKSPCSHAKRVSGGRSPACLAGEPPKCHSPASEIALFFIWGFSSKRAAALFAFLLTITSCLVHVLGAVGEFTCSRAELVSSGVIGKVRP